MKICPVCQASTIPYKWIFFGISKSKNGCCIKCSNCGNNIKKRGRLIIDLFLHNGLTFIVLFIILFFALNEIIKNPYLSTLLVLFSLISFSRASEYFLPLREADESYCRGDMTKVGAVFALIAIPSIIIFTLYALFYKL